MSNYFIGGLFVDSFKNIVPQYCPVISKNVIIERSFDENNQQKCECLNKNCCGFNKKGCNNSLISSYNDIQA